MTKPLMAAKAAKSVLREMLAAYSLILISLSTGEQAKEHKR
jgi:hypothetical protein